MIDVLKEHLEYLNLAGRSELYKSALAETVRAGDTAADLGCGLGVLGIFCLEAGASQVWGIDNSEAIHLARESMVGAGLEDRYHCVANTTFHAELPAKVDLIVCDHVGFFGFDYGIIDMLTDARRRFLKAGGAVMPRSMDLLIAGVSSQDCRDKASAWEAENIPPQFRWLDGYHRNSKHHHDFTEDELISGPIQLGQIAFDQENPEVFAFKARLTMTNSGLFDGIAGWFDCELSDTVRMTNSPFDAASIKRAQAFLPVAEPFAVEVGDVVIISIRFRHDVSMIAWTIEPPAGGARQKLSTWNGTILTPADLVQTSQKPLSLSAKGAARRLILEQVDGSRSAEEIAKIVLARQPDLFPSEQATRDFVMKVLTQDCTT